MQKNRPAIRLWRKMIYGWRSGGGSCWRAIRRGIASWKLIETMRSGAALTPFPDRFKQIGSKDFPMPENSSSKLPRTGLLLLRDEVGLKFSRRHIADRGVKAFLAVNLLEECSDGGPCLVEIPVFVAMNFFVF